MRQIGDEIVAKWILRATVTEPFFGSVRRMARILLPGAVIVRLEKDKITQWSDYHDSWRSRRSAVAAFITDWLELGFVPGVVCRRNPRLALRGSCEP